MASNKKQGERNKKLSEKLFAENTYFDWSITTAFYSVIHIVEAHLLPCKVRDHHCTKINEVRAAYGMRGRHAARERLVQEKLSHLFVPYKWLDDKSRTARYVTYKITKAEAEKAQTFLKIIHAEIVKVS